MSFPVAFVSRDSFTPLSESRLPTDVPSRRRSSGMTEAKGSVPNCQDVTVQGCGPESTGISIIWISCLKYGFPGSPRDSGSGVHTGAGHLHVTCYPVLGDSGVGGWEKPTDHSWRNWPCKCAVKALSWRLLTPRKKNAQKFRCCL